jgi:thiol-disulfide isomerase/thioredoxin
MKRRLPTFLIVLAAGALAYSLAAGPAARNYAPIAGAAARAAGPAAFSAAALDGTSWSLENERGKVVLINFWATWCPPCRQETPDLVRTAEQYASRGLAVVGVSMDEGEADVIHRFVRDYRVPYTIVRPTAGQPIPFSVQALPTSFLLDRRGRIAKTYVGAVSEAVLKTDIDALLAEAAPETDRNTL